MSNLHKTNKLIEFINSLIINKYNNSLMKNNIFIGLDVSTKSTGFSIIDSDSI